MHIIEKALDVLESITKQRDGVKLSTLAEITGFNQSTTYRISSILIKKGYLRQNGKRGKYFPGIKLLEISDIAKRDAYIKEQAFPFLKKLGDNISETITMTVFDGVEHTNIIVIPPKYSLQVVPRIGTKLPLHCTASGKIFLANMPDEKFNHIITVLGLSTYTDKTITDISKLKRQMETIRREDFALDDEEYEYGVRGIAAPVKYKGEIVIAAISLVGPSMRMSILKIKQLVPVVKSCALEISESLVPRGK
jgi:DNA-binding IclR family transcriptional regulator